jgi:hypothetical protein
MRNNLRQVFFVVFMFFLLTGCEKKSEQKVNVSEETVPTAEKKVSDVNITIPEKKIMERKRAGLEGKVLDGKGQPLNGIQILAKQVQPINGYEKFETTSSSDGKFSFKKLCPLSMYMISPSAQDWETDIKITIQSGAESEVVTLPFDVIVRFMVTKDGVITDTKTGLQWAPNLLQEAANWEDSKAFVENLNFGGFTDWRLPTLAELESLYDKSLGVECKLSSLFRLQANCCYAWSSELYGTSDARYYRFTDGGQYWCSRKSNYSQKNFITVLPVRSPV